MVHRYLLHRLSVPTNTLWPLGLYLAGILLFALNDSQFNVKGALFACASAVLTTIYHIQKTAVSRQFSITFVQVNLAVSLPRTLFMIVIAAATEVTIVIRREFQGLEVAFLLVSGFLVVVIECLPIWFFTRAGSLGAVIADNVKTVAVIGAGLVLFPVEKQAAERNGWRIFGICVAVVGIVGYSVANRKNLEVENRAMVAFREEEEQIEAPVALIVPGVEFEKDIERDEE
jgi:hypothetical protein